MQSICRERKCRRENSFNFLNPDYTEANYFVFVTSLIREENHPGFATWFMKAFTLVLMNQEQSASCWEKNICSILPARRESNTFPARRRDNNVSQQGRFRLIIAEGRKKKARVRPINYIINFYIKSCALLLNFTLFYVSQEGSVLRTYISKNSCRWLLLMNPE